MHQHPSPPPGTQTLARGLAALQAVAEGQGDLHAVASFVGVSRSTTHRLLQLLEMERYIRRNRQGKYELGPTLIEFGFKAQHQTDIPRVARPILEELSQRFQDTVHLAVRDAGSVLYLDKITSARGAQMRSRIGFRMPLTRTGVGRALILDEESSWEDLARADLGDSPSQQEIEGFLTCMKDFSAQGVAFDLEENEPGVRCVAAPVRDVTGEIIAGISISATNPYMPKKRMHSLSPVLKAAGLRISKELGYTPPRGKED